MTLKKIDKCRDCPSCKNNGEFYCRMMAAEGPQYADISTCYVDPETKPENCPWDVTRQIVEELDFKDKLALRSCSRAFGFDDLLEPEPIKLYRRMIKPIVGEEKDSYTLVSYSTEEPEIWYPENEEAQLREKYKHVMFVEKYEPVVFEE